MRIDFSHTQRRADDLERFSRLWRAGRAIVAALFVAALIAVVFTKPVDRPAEREAALAKHLKLKR